LTPGEEVLLPRDEYEMVTILTEMSDEQRAKIGRLARERMLAEHTSTHRAEEFERVVERVS
jgi:spore maturation protein CgeB